MQLDIDALLAAAERWGTHHPVIGWLVMGWLGGVVAAVRMYERAGVSFTWGAFIARCVVKGLIGVFVALLFYAGWKASGWSQDWGLLVGGVCGVFGTEVLEAILVLGWDVLRKRAGVEPKAFPKSDTPDSGR